MTVSYKRNSNYRNTKITDGELDHYTPPIKIDFKRTTRITLEQKYNLRPDRLAYDLYNDAQLWWIFALYNRNILLDPIHDFTTGSVIFVPTKDYVAGL